MDIQSRNAVARLKYKIKKECELKIKLGINFSFFVNEYGVDYVNGAFHLSYFVGDTVEGDYCYTINNVCETIIERSGINTEYMVKCN